MLEMPQAKAVTRVAVFGFTSRLDARGLAVPEVAVISVAEYSNATHSYLVRGILRG